MKQTLLNDLRCPACLGSLTLHDAEFKGELIFNGQLICGACARSYAIREGAAYLAVLDSRWATILKELINRRRIIVNDLLREPGADDARQHRLSEQQEISTDIAETCFRAAQQELDFSRPLRVLDCGAGMFETSQWFAEQGADVTATETEITTVQYANFKELFPQPPTQYHLGTQLCHERNPEPFPYYFNRLVCDLHRLPLAAGTFDVAFCRAMLHHVESPATAIAEMVRVTRPGGVIVICSEPIRSILDREDDYTESAVDREEGMNEQAPTIFAYRRPLTAFSDRMSMQCWPDQSRSRTKRLFDLLGYDYGRHLHHGEKISNWKWLKWALSGGGLNVYARRNGRPGPAPAAYRDSAHPWPVDEVVDAYLPGDDPISVELIRTGTEKLAVVRRRLLAEQAERFSYSLSPGRSSGLILESGWSARQELGGQSFRHILKHAALVLRLKPNATQLVVEGGGGSGGFAYHCAVSLNGLPAGEFAGSGSEWQRFNIPLSKEIKKAGSDRILQVEFECQQVHPHPELGQEVGPAISLLSQ